MPTRKRKTRDAPPSEVDPMIGPLIGMPIEEARRAKWLRGKAEHGPIMVLDPLDEMFAEAIDGTNYTGALLQEPCWTLDERKKLMRAEMAFHRIARVAQALKAAKPKRRYEPRAVEFS